MTGPRSLLPLPLLVALLLLFSGCDGVSDNGASDSETSTPPAFTTDQGWHRSSIEHNDRERLFKYYVPETLSPDAPMVMTLHGATRGMDEMFDQTVGGANREWIDIAEEEGLLLLVPNASHDRQPVWNDCTPLPKRGGTPDDSGYLDRLADWAENQADVDPARFYVYGVSNGGQMANRLAIEHPDRFASVAAFISNITASLGEGEECARPSEPIPVLTVSGTDDSVTPYEGGYSEDWGDELLSAPATRDLWVENNQADPSQPTEKVYDRNADDEQRVVCITSPAPETGAGVQLCRVEGAGHSLPTIEHQIPGAPSNRDVESARLAWRFFQRQ